MLRYVYFVQAHKTALVKIGSAVDVNKRIKGLRKIVPDTLSLLGVQQETNILSEKSIHAKFHDIRVHGEWFYPSHRLLDYVKKNTSLVANQPEKSVPCGPLNTPGAVGWLVLGKRRQLKLTQIELAERAGVSRQLIVEIEKGHHQAQIGCVLSILSALGLTLTCQQNH